MYQDKWPRVQGGPYSKFVQIMRNVGYNEASTIRLATVKKAPPEIEVQIDHDAITLDKHDLRIAEHLTKHSRTANIIADATTVNMTSEGYSPHTHDVNKIVLTNATVEFTDELKPGDRVLVEIDDAAMKYTIIDRVVSYR